MDASDAAAAAEAIVPAPTSPKSSSSSSSSSSPPPACAPKPADISAAADPAPIAVPVPQRPPSTRIPVTHTVLAGVGVVALAVALAVLVPPLVARVHTWWTVGGGLPPVVYALAHVVPIEPCTPVNREDILNGTTLHGTVNLRNVRASLYHHIHHSGPAGPLNGIAAQFLERHRVCYALVNMTFADSDAPNLVEMYNLRIMGSDTSGIVRNLESSLLCEHPYTVRRFETIYASWDRPDGGHAVMRDIGGRAAQTLQQMYDVQVGNGHCEDSNLEAQMHRLDQRIRAVHGQVMAHGHAGGGYVADGGAPLQLPP